MLKKLLVHRKSAHYYTKSGQPVHQVPAKKGGLKNTTIKEARELGLVPSVTTILNILDKTSIHNWLRDRSIKFTYLLGKRTGKLKAHFERILDLTDSTSNNAIAFGKDIHEQIENFVKHGQPLPNNIADKLKGFHGFVSEFSYCNGLVAGTIDITCLDINNFKVIIDTKTQKTKPNKPFIVYDTTKLQIGAYDSLYPADKYFVLFVSSTEKDRVELVEIPCAEIDKAKTAFEYLRKVYYLMNELKED